LVRSQRWLSGSSIWITTIYVGQLSRTEKGEVVLAVEGKDIFKYKGDSLDLDSNSILPHTKGLPMSVDPQKRGIKLYLWKSKYALKKEAKRPFLSEKVVGLIFKYL